MNAYGKLVPDAEIINAIERMKWGPFSRMQLAKYFSGPKADRIADRLIQRERKAGNIAFDRKAWHWVKAG